MSESCFIGFCVQIAPCSVALAETLEDFKIFKSLFSMSVCTRRLKVVKLASFVDLVATAIGAGEFGLLELILGEENKNEGTSHAVVQNVCHQSEGNRRNHQGVFV